MATMNPDDRSGRQRQATAGRMIGFDTAKAKEVFNIGERYSVAMMVTLGYAKDGNWPRKPRLAASEVTVLDGRRAHCTI